MQWRLASCNMQRRQPWRRVRRLPLHCAGLGPQCLPLLFLEVPHCYSDSFNSGSMSLHLSHLKKLLPLPFAFGRIGWFCVLSLQTEMFQLLFHMLRLLK